VVSGSSEAPDATLLAASDRADLRAAAAALTVATLSDGAAQALAREIHRWHVLVDIAHNPLSAPSPGAAFPRTWPRG
jgi:hypothetical protein